MGRHADSGRSYAEKPFHRAASIIFWFICISPYTLHTFYNFSPFELFEAKAAKWSDGLFTVDRIFNGHIGLTIQ